ncbi:MAG: DNA internalization-related competence protein ComEC/Rec2 [Bacteroidota bacterium]
MLRRRPALRVVVLLVGGILLSDLIFDLWRIPFPAFTGWVLLGTLWSVSLVLVILRPRSALAAFFLHATVLVLGVLWATVRTADLDERKVLPSASGAIRFTALLEEPPLKQGSTCKLVVVADSMPGAVQNPRLLVFLPWKRSSGIRSLDVGRTVMVSGSVQEFPRPRNPGEFDYGRYLTLNDIQGIIQADSVHLGPETGPGSVRGWFAALRSEFGKIFSRHHGSEQAGFLQGVVFGDRREISADLKESFMLTGTTHILAVSGSNVALIALMLYLLFGMLRFPKRWIVVLTILGLLFYMLLTGASSSIVRATIMGCVLVIGTAMERRTDIYNSISVAAVIVLLLDPLQLYDVGFQLSFAAVLSIVSIYPKLERLVELIPAKWEEFRILIPVWKVFAVSLAAQLGTLPFTAYYFERVSLVSLIANIIVVPLVGVNLILGCMTLAADAISTAIASVYAALNELLVDILLGFVREAASVPFAAVDTFGFGLIHALLFYTILLALMNPSNVQILKFSIFSVLMILNVSLYGKMFEVRTLARVVMLDVGQGDAILLRLTNGSHVLVDAGPKAFGYDAGKRVLVPFLRRQGISRLDAVVLSHPHSDHIGGLEAVMEEVEVHALYEADTAIVSRLHRGLRSAARRHRVPLVTAGRGDNISPDPNARVFVLHPGIEDKRSQNVNDASLCLKVLIGRTSIFFSGDAEGEAEGEMTRRYGGFLSSDILKAGHHGSSTSSGAQFLDSITPKIALISVGERNKFGHPSPGVVRLFQTRNTTVLRTDREGALVFESDGFRWKQIDWR